MTALSFGSLFSGIGGLDLGLVWAGFAMPSWQVEIDPWCRGLLEVRFPGVPRYGDVRTVDPTELAPVDLVCGGFPCQPISNAGRRRAQEDERWLWPEFARIVRVLRPRYVLVENVAALLYRGFDDVQADLAALGYDTEWDCIPASAVGAPHERDRVWLLAYSPGARRGLAGGAVTGEADRRRALGEPARSGGALAHADGGAVVARGRRGRAPEAGELADADVDGRDAPRDGAGEDERPPRSEPRAPIEPRGGVADAPGLGRRSGRARGSDPSGAGEPERALPALADADGARRQQVARGAPRDEEADEGRTAQGDHEPAGDGEGLREGVAYPDGGRLTPKDEDVRAWQRDLGRRGALADTDLERLEERGVRPAARRNEIPDAPGRGRRGAASMADTYFAGSQGHRRLRERAREQLSWADGETVEGGRLAPPTIRRVAHGIPHRVDRLRALGNAVVPQLVAYVAERIAEHEARDG